MKAVVWRGHEGIGTVEAAEHLDAGKPGRTKGDLGTTA
jgi:hypothetical protein